MPEPFLYRVYISGPMTGLPEFNYPLFNKVARYIVMDQRPVPGKAPKGTAWLVVPINPADNFEGRTDLSREVYLERALRQVDQANAIVLLPGWQSSPGARLEVQRGLHNGAHIYVYVEHSEYEYQFLPLDHETVKATLDAWRQQPDFVMADEERHPPKPAASETHDEWIEMEASRLVRNGERQKNYGHPRGDFDTIARLWSPLLGIEVDADKVALCMIALKMARLVSNPKHHDSLVDIIGYAICKDRLNEPQGAA